MGSVSAKQHVFIFFIFNRGAYKPFKQSVYFISQLNESVHQRNQFAEGGSEHTINLKPCILIFIILYIYYKEFSHPSFFLRMEKLRGEKGYIKGHIIKSISSCI